MSATGIQRDAVQVGLHMIDTDQRLPHRPRERLRSGHTDEERTDESRPMRDGDRVDVSERRVRLAQRAIDDGKDLLDMGARGDLRHDAAVDGVEVKLRRDHAR